MTEKYSIAIKARSVDLKKDIQKLFKLISATIDENVDICVFNALNMYYKEISKKPKRYAKK